MRTILIDCETVPLPIEQLEAIMPEELKNAVMPEDIANPGEVDLNKCPAYGGDEAKQAAWKEKTTAAWKEKCATAKGDWSLKQMEAKQSWIDRAALDASTGEVKLIGLWDVETGQHIIHVVSAENQERLINAPFPKDTILMHYPTERAMIASLWEMIHDDHGCIGAQLVGYNIESFDLPFLYRRSWILGVETPRLRRGKYWNEDHVCDLRTVYQLGDRQYKMGGLKGLAKTLGVKEKRGDGKMFWQMWRDDPVEAINYNLDEGVTIYECAKKMGVI